MVEKLNENDTYSTTDLGCSSALVALGFQLEDLDKSSPNRAIFIFKNSEDLTHTVDKYWDGNLSIKAKSYFETQKWLKSRIYNR